jgi:hypothetical protein
VATFRSLLPHRKTCRPCVRDARGVVHGVNGAFNWHDDDALR